MSDPTDVDHTRLTKLSMDVAELMNALPAELLAGGAGVLVGAGVGVLLNGSSTVQQVHDLVDMIAGLHAQGVGQTPPPANVS